MPKWIDRRSGKSSFPLHIFSLLTCGTSPDQFASLCFVRADLSKLSSSAEPKVGADGQRYWLVVFAIEILFGLTEFKARMKWIEDVSLI